MEPVTHVLTGACLARSGLNRRAAYATLAMAIAAEFPDVDVLWGLRGPVEGFVHHRGITHSLIGLPLEAAALTGLFWAVHAWRMRRQPVENTPGGGAGAAAPVRWGVLYGLILLALFSHLALDFTNNYGVRPFFPFNPHWYAASIVFIFDPLLFVLLLGALVLPWIFRLVNAEVGARREPFAGAGIARGALLLVLAYYGVRAWEHGRAVDAARAESVALEPSQPEVTAGAQPEVSSREGAGASASALGASASAADLQTPQVVYRTPDRVLASPDPLDPRRWYTVSDYGTFYQLATVRLDTPTAVQDGRLQAKLNATPALLAAFATPLGRAYLDWSPMPFVTLRDGGLAEAEPPSEPGHHTVTLADPRFMGETLLLHSAGRTPLTGQVELDGRDRVVAQALDERVERDH